MHIITTAIALYCLTHTVMATNPFEDAQIPTINKLSRTSSFYEHRDKRFPETNEEFLKRIETRSFSQPDANSLVSPMALLNIGRTERKLF